MQTESIKFKEIPTRNVNFVGALTFDNNGKLYIMINQGIDNMGRQNFTIAHELGHYFLNHLLNSTSFFCQESQIVEEANVTNSIEHEANYFASCFLMPKQKITSAFFGMLKYSHRAKNKDFLVVNKTSFGIWCNIRDSLTKRYGVSEAALRYRLNKLMLLQFEFL
ncbi:MAG: ImmA/IrrE family metallo-endopeptidase [Treponema sp.]|nr:ImmA/IrrE family metallo-endopeptidase [Treponema sp.]